MMGLLDIFFVNVCCAPAITAFIKLNKLNLIESVSPIFSFILALQFRKNSEWKI